MKAQERIYSLNRGVESLSKEEHGLFFDTVQRLGLSNEVKLAAVALYLDFKSRPIGEYNAATGATINAAFIHAGSGLGFVRLVTVIPLSFHCARWER